MCFYYGCLKWLSHLPAHSPLDVNELWAVIQMIPLPSKWRQQVRSYESLTFIFTPKLTQPVTLTVAWQSMEDDDGFSSDLKSFLEFPLLGWSFHLYAQNGLSQIWCHYTHVRRMLWMKDLFICSKSSTLSLTLKTLFDRILSKDPIWEGFVALDFWASL